MTLYDLQPITYVRVPMPVATASISSNSTLRQRSKQVSQVRDIISGGPAASAVQLKDELRHLRKERDDLLKEAGLIPTGLYVTQEESLALKADLSIPWTKLRALRR